MSPSPDPGSQPLRILVLARDDAGAERLSRECDAKVLPAHFERVAELEAFLEVFAEPVYDVILIDGSMAGAEAARALGSVRERAPHTPVIVIAGDTDDPAGASAVREAASAYVAADRLDELVPVIRAVRERAAHRIGESGFGAYSAPHQAVMLQYIAQHSWDIVCLHAPDRSIQFVTPSIKRVLGYDPPDWIGRHPRDYAHPDDLARILEGVRAALESGGPTSGIVGRFRHKEGHYVWLETIVRPIRDESGRITRILSVSRDFTERKRIEESLRRGERLFEGIAEANRLLLTAKRVMDSLPAVLCALGEASGADRVVVFEWRPSLGPETPGYTLRAEWARFGQPSLYGRVELSEIAVAPSDAPKALGLHATPSGLLRVLEGHGLRHLTMFSIPVQGRGWGVLGYAAAAEEAAWTSGEISALGMVALNIGQSIAREQTLAAFAESQRRYETLLAGLSEGVFQIDLEARWRFLNPTWEELTGFRVDESIGRRFSAFIAREEAAAALEGFGRLVSGRDERIESEVRFLHRRGNEIWLRVNAKPQLDEQGRMVGVSGTLVDVTQRRLAQEAMRASERKFAAVFAGSSDALFLFDNATNLIVECNPRAVELFECESPADLIGSSGTTLRHRTLSRAEIAEGMGRLDRGEAWSSEIECVTRRGRVFWGLFAVVRMAPETLGTTLVRVTDISGLKRSEERLRASLGEKEVLLKEVYHRVKNNLQIISALLRMQSRRVKDGIAVEALENSISRVMAMSMVHEKLYQAQNLVSIDFLSFAQSLVGFLNQLTIGGQAGVTIAVSGEPLALSIDQAIPLGLILNELVTNSLKYAYPEGRQGRISISIGSNGGGNARVVVADDGVGLPEAGGKEDGEGLGFRIVRMLVEQLHGELDLVSRQGLKATVRVPPPVLRAKEVIGS